MVFPAIKDSADYKDLLCAVPDSTFETIILNTSGIIVSHYIRLLGGTSNIHRDIKSYNEHILNNQWNRSFLIIGDDIVGGVYVIDMGLFGNPGKVFFYQPDCLQWMNTDKDYTEFLAWILNGDLQEFYGKLWTNDCEVPFDKTILYYPFVWTEEFDIKTASAKYVSVSEIASINGCFDICR